MELFKEVKIVGYNPEKIIILDKESFIQEKLKNLLKTLKMVHIEITPEQIEKEKQQYAAKYDDLMTNGCDVGGLVPCYEKIKNIVLYEGWFGFLNNKNVLYYLTITD
jgi:hypothetical protein